jgi:hypothetical protein
MTDISKRLEQLVSNSQKRIQEKNGILPVKCEDGILVGTVLIKSQGHLKYLYRQNKLIYKEISLNKIAISMANLMAMNRDYALLEKMYRADQDYGKYYNESQYLRMQYEKARTGKNFERADILWNKYIETKNKAIQAKNKAESLSII